MKTIRQILFAALAMWAGAGAMAQEEAPKSFPTQFSFAYPIGTNGTESVNYEYNFSLNLLTGKVRSIKGFEMGGLLNFTEEEMDGFQVAGIGNHLKGNMTGAQVAGIYSFAKNVNGFQMSGIYSSTDDVMGGQASGIYNHADTLNGFQVSGIFNDAKPVNGLQLTGIYNTSENLNGSQVAGIYNHANQVQGLQLGGAYNKADEANGMQATAVYNDADSINGMQLAGVTNLSRGRTNGMQLAGVYNQTKKLNGFQLGLVNYADSIGSGVQLGLVSVVRKNGYWEAGVSASDYNNTELTFKMGSRTLYNVYSVGANYFPEQDQLWVFGLGLGHITDLGKTFTFQPEAMYYAYFPNDFEDIRQTHSARFKLMFMKKIGQHMGISVAPSAYFVYKQLDGEQYGYDITPVDPLQEWFIDNHNQHKFEFGLGASIGFHIF